MCLSSFAQASEITQFERMLFSIDILFSDGRWLLSIVSTLLGAVFIYQGALRLKRTGEGDREIRPAGTIARFVVGAFLLTPGFVLLGLQHEVFGATDKGHTSFKEMVEREHRIRELTVKQGERKSQSRYEECVKANKCTEY